MKKIVLALLLISFISPLSKAHFQESKTLFVVGSTSVANLIDVVSEEFYQQTGFQVLMRSIGSDKGIVSIAEKVSDIGVISRFLSIEEQKKYPQLEHITIAQDAIVFMVNEKNKLSSLTHENILELYTANKPTWPDKSPAYVMTKNRGHGTHDSFLEYFKLSSARAQNGLGVVFKQNGISHLFSKNGLAPYSRVNQAIANVFRREDAIAYESLGAYKNFIKSQEYIRTKLIALDNKPPIVNNKVNPEYPFKRPLNIVINKEPSPMVEAFIAFINSEKGRKLIEQNYFIAVE